MCYSLEASVLAGAGLGVVGTATVSRALRHDRKMLGFAIFPLVFSFHQFTEGVVWYSLAHPFQDDDFFRYLYTAIAFMAWPILSPYAAAMADPNPARRILWTAMFFCGLLLDAYLLLKLMGAEGVDVEVVRHSLVYTPQFEHPPWVVHYSYMLLSVTPLFMFPNRAVKLFGVAVFLTFFWALSQNREAWYSVWCMAAATFSLILAFAVKRGEAPAYDAAHASS